MGEENVRQSIGAANGAGLTLALAGALALALPAIPAMAQPAQKSQAVVQTLPAAEQQALNSALARLGRNAKDVNALIDAGNAALALGDVDAAVGFFASADQIQPNSPRVRAGLAAALVQNGNPFDAIPLFTEAENAGGIDLRLNADRGLAYDLVGDNATAQKYYRQVLNGGNSDEVTRRLALSLAISGNRDAMEATLLPLLQKQDKPAFRTRAFALAALGKTDEAVSIAYQSMPQDLAAAIAPYLRYMPRLTRAQQASAATFGHFPRAADIGRDDPRIERYAPPVHVATAEGRLVPKGQSLGQPAKSANDKVRVAANTATRPAAVAVRMAPPDLQPRREESTAPSLVQPPAIVPEVAAPPAEPAKTIAVAVAVPQPPVPQMPALQPAVSQPPAPQPAASAPIAKEPYLRAKVINFNEIFGDLGAPTTVAAPASGAVDVRKIASVRPRAETKPAHPSRVWIQVGTGRGKAALQGDWKALVKQAPELLRSRSASMADWGKTNRLLTGPFENEPAARALLTKLKKQKIGAFVWTSPAGQVVDPLSGK